jgi:hypothetical protein
VIALGAYGFVATFQPDPNFGRILAAYGGIFVAGSLAWGVVLDKFQPDRWDYLGAGLCLIGVAIIMYAPRYLFVAPDQGVVVARSGMTDAPSRVHDPGGGVTGPGGIGGPLIGTRPPVR